MGCARTGTRWRWPNRVIPYTIDGDDFPENTISGVTERNAIATAIAAWTSVTSLKIQPRQQEPNFIKFVAADEEGACSSHVGRKQWFGAQEIPCNPAGGALVHEIGHAIGLWHEQSREDRDRFVTINTENVRSDKLHNFDRHVDDGSDLGRYDYGSVMHYGSRSFVVDWRPGKRILGQSTKGSPAVAPVGAEIHMVHLGESTNDLWHSHTNDGRSWSDNVRVPGQQSKAAPAVAEWNGALHMVHLGNSSNDIWYSRSSDLRRWSNNVRISNQKSMATPALCAFNGELHMLHLGDTSRDIWHSWTADGTNWSERQIPGQRSKAAPALAVFGNQLHMVHLGDTSNDLWHSSTADGRRWTANSKVEGQQSRAAPSITSFGGGLHLAHVGDTSSTIWHSRFDGQAWRPNNRRDNNQSSMTPSLIAFDSELFMVHRGRSTAAIWTAVRDTTLLTIEPPAGVVLGGGAPSQGDIAAVTAMYS